MIINEEKNYRGIIAISKKDIGNLKRGQQVKMVVADNNKVTIAINIKGVERKFYLLRYEFESDFELAKQVFMNYETDKSIPNRDRRILHYSTQDSEPHSMDRLYTSFYIIPF